MNFNHLMEKRSLLRACAAPEHIECYYEPASDTRATSGGNVHVQMRCRHCGQREDIFLSESEYTTHHQILQREIENV